MLNTSLHNKSARFGGPFTYEKFYNSLTEAISTQNMPDTATIKVDVPRYAFFVLRRCFILEYL